MYEILENGQVLKVERDGDTIIKTHHCMSKQITLEPVTGGVKIRIRDWEGQFLPLEPVLVTITGGSVQTVTEICSDGLVELQGLAGVEVKVSASAAGMDSAEMVVIL